MKGSQKPEYTGECIDLRVGIHKAEKWQKETPSPWRTVTMRAYSHAGVEFNKCGNPTTQGGFTIIQSRKGKTNSKEKSYSW